MKKPDKKYTTTYRFGLTSTSIGFFFTITLDGKKDLEKALSTAQQLFRERNIGCISIGDPSTPSLGDAAELIVVPERIGIENIIDSKTHAD
jgi:hypothetical protein